MKQAFYGREAIEGHNFLDTYHDTYNLIVNYDEDGLPYLTLERWNEDDTVSELFNLEMSDIYAQCSPSRIMKHLKADNAIASQLMAQFSKDTDIPIGEN